MSIYQKKKIGVDPVSGKPIFENDEQYAARLRSVGAATQTTTSNDGGRGTSKQRMREFAAEFNKQELERQVAPQIAEANRLNAELQKQLAYQRNYILNFDRSEMKDPWFRLPADNGGAPFANLETAWANLCSRIAPNKFTEKGKDLLGTYLASNCQIDLGTGKSKLLSDYALRVPADVLRPGVFYAAYERLLELGLLTEEHFTAVSVAVHEDPAPQKSIAERLGELPPPADNREATYDEKVLLEAGFIEHARPVALKFLEWLATFFDYTMPADRKKAWGQLFTTYNFDVANPRAYERVLELCRNRGILPSDIMCTDDAVSKEVERWAAEKRSAGVDVPHRGLQLQHQKLLAQKDKIVPSFSEWLAKR